MCANSQADFIPQVTLLICKIRMSFQTMLKTGILGSAIVTTVTTTSWHLPVSAKASRVAVSFRVGPFWRTGLVMKTQLP